MPFFDVGAGGAFKRLDRAAAMPRPLNVAILDRRHEREGRTTAVLVDPFGYQDDVERLTIEVPQGFLTDFASIPAWARAVVSPFGRHAKAAVLHDWLYAIGEPGGRALADRVFQHAMTELEVEGWAKALMHGAVRVGGGGAYDRAAADWPNTFADETSGETLPPLFDRESAFIDAPNGPKRF